MRKDNFSPRILLLVDDDEDDQHIFQEALKIIDTNIICYLATDGKDALAKLRDALLVPDVIFLDLNMPVMTGKDCLIAIKSDKDLKQIPVIVYSTSSMEREKANCMKLGAASFLSKPTEFNVLVKRLEECLRTVWKDMGEQR